MYTVVVADDEEELRRALIRKVDWNRIGFQVVGEAENGVEALEMVEKYEPDLLLTDIKMPYISGIELARQVREVRPMTQIAFLSGFDDFTYAQQAIQYNIISYLLKPISSAELMSELEKIKKKIDDKFQEFTAQNTDQMELSGFLMPLMLDSSQQEQSVEREERVLKEAVSSGLLKDVNNEFKYTVIVTSITNNDGKNCTIRSSVNAIDIILRKYIRHSSFYAEGKVVSLLMATTSGFEKYLHILVEDIVQSVKRIMNCTCTLGVSRQISYLSGIHEGYLEAMNALGYSKKLNNNVCFIADMEKNEDLKLETMQNYIGEIENLVRGGTEEDLKSTLTEIFEHMDNEHLSPVASYFMMGQVIAEVYRIVYAVADKDAIKELQKHTPPQNQYFNSNNEEVCRKYMDFCLTAKGIISDQRKQSGTVLCERAINIIKSKYMDPDLSLVSVSNEISVSPNYLSALIKKMTGNNFVELLTRQRIEKAKELLTCTSMKIREISEACGYNDQHYFSYCFKKVTGNSPNSLRRN